MVRDVESAGQCGLEHVGGVEWWAVITRCSARADRGRGAILTNVKAIRAHIQDGKIVPDEPIELPEGAAVEVLVPENEEMSAEERVELESEIAASAAEFERGEYEDAHAFALRLVARS